MCGSAFNQPTTDHAKVKSFLNCFASPRRQRGAEMDRCNKQTNRDSQESASAPRSRYGSRFELDDSDYLLGHNKHRELAARSSCQAQPRATVD